MPNIPIIFGVITAAFGTIGFVFLIRNDWKPQWLRALVLKRSDRRCMSLVWAGVPQGPLIDRNDCQDCVWGIEHKSNTEPPFEHESSACCWRRTIGEVFSFSESTQVPFPRSLDDPKRFLAVDVNVLLAFILSVIPDVVGEFSQFNAPGTVFDGSVVQLSEEGENIIGHVRGTHRRYLTAEDCSGLILGYPPWYRRTIKLTGPGANLTLDHPCFGKESNCHRGGWVIAVALSDVRPVPAYVDRTMLVDDSERGAVLRAGCERVLEILRRFQFLDMPPPSNLYAATYKIRKFLTKKKGASWGSIVDMPDVSTITPENWRDLARVAIQIFDTEPALGFSSEGTRMLQTHGDLVVYWANYGVYKVMRYHKKPGREIIRDERLKPGRKIYLQDCQYSMI